MKRKILVLLAVAVLSLSGFAVTACGSKQTASGTVNGFDVKETLEVPQYTSVAVEEPLVTDAAGNLLDVYTEVTDSKGGYVTVTAGQFFATDADGYTIRYVVVAADGSVHEKKTAVFVTRTSTLTAAYDEVETVGEPIEVRPQGAENDEVTFTVTNTAGGEDGVSYDRENMRFTCAAAGLYTVALDSQNHGSYSYEIAVREPIARGEVESYTASWEYVATVVDTGRRMSGYGIVDTEESGVKDRYGNPGEFLCIVSTDEYFNLYINPQQDKSYYEQLAEEGYEYVSLWVYVQSAKNISHITARRVDPNGGFYQHNNTGTLQPNEWLELRLNLQDGPDDFNRSFITCYDWYASQQLPFLIIDNSYDYNPDGGGDTMTIYVDDIYAVKPASASLKANAQTTFDVADPFEPDELVESDCELSYFITDGEKRIFLPHGYRFTHNGTYSVEAISAEADKALIEPFTFTVTAEDNFTPAGNSVFRNMDTEPEKVAFSAFNVDFGTKDGITPAITSYTVRRMGELVAAEADGFTAAAEGLYTVEVRADYVKDGLNCYTTATFTLDVYTAEAQFDIVPGTADNMHAVRGWGGEVSIAYDRSLNGVSNLTRLTIDNTADGRVDLYVNLLHSEAYWQYRNATDDKSYRLMFAYYIESTMAVHDVCTNYIEENSWDSRSAGRWYTVSLDINAEHAARLLASGGESFRLLGVNNFRGSERSDTALYITDVVLIELPPVSSDSGKMTLTMAEGVHELYIYNGQDEYPGFEFVWTMATPDGQTETLGAASLDLASLDEGMHTLTLTAYSKSSTLFKQTVYTEYIDIYSDLTAETLLAEAGTELTWENTFTWGGSTEKTYDVTFGGKTDLMEILAPGTMQASGVEITLPHTGAYYRELAKQSEYADSIVTFAYRLENGNDSGLTYRDVLDVNRSWRQVPVGQWQTITLTLNELADYLDGKTGGADFDHVVLAVNNLQNGVNYPTKIYVTDVLLLTAPKVLSGQTETVQRDLLEEYDLSDRYDTTPYAGIYTFSWSYKSPDGASYTVESDAIDPSYVTEDGLYTLTLTAYSANDLYSLTVYTFTLDVYTAGKVSGTVAPAEAGHVNMVYPWTGSVECLYGQTLDNRTGLVRGRNTQNPDAIAIQIVPVHSAAYYDMLAKNEDGSSYKVRLLYRIESTGSASYPINIPVISASDYPTKMTGEWHALELSLEQFVEYLNSGSKYVMRIAIQNTSDEVCLYATKAVLVRELGTEQGETVLVERSALTGYSLAGKYDTTEYGEIYDFIWTYVAPDGTGGTLEGDAFGPEYITADGLYTLTLTAHSEGDVYTQAVYTFTLDVYTAADDYTGVIAPAAAGSVDVKSVYTWDSGEVTCEYGVTFGEKEWLAHGFAPSGRQTSGIIVTPIHSADYYRMLDDNANGISYKIRFSYRLENGETAGSPTVRNVEYANKLSTWDNADVGKWQTIEWSLTDFIAYLDGDRAELVRINNLYSGKQYDTNVYVTAVELIAE